MFDKLKKRYDALLNPINQGLSQVSRNVPQPVKSFVKPIAQEVRNIATQQIPSAQRVLPLTQPLQNPVGFVNAAQQQIRNFQQNKPKQAAMNVGKDIFNTAKLGANVYGSSKILAGGALNAAKTMLPNAAIGGAFSKMTGGSFSEGAGQGVAMSPGIRGITGVTNPLIEKYTQMLAPKLAPTLTNNAVGNYLATSTLRGMQNVPEGAVIDASMGRRPLSPASVGLDFASGFIPGKPKIMADDFGELVKKGEVLGLKGINPRAFQLPEEEKRAAMSVLDVLRYDRKSGATTEDRQYALQTLQNLLEGYAPGYKVTNTKKALDAMEWIIQTNDQVPGELRTKLPKMGLVGDSQKRVEQVFKTEKFDVGQNEVKVIKNLQKQLGLETRDVRTFDEMKAMAEEMGTSPKQLLNDIQTGRITDKEVISLGNIISTSSQRIQKLSNQLKRNPGNEKLQSQLAVEEELINQAIRKRIRGGTEAGRAVAAFRAIANRNLEPSYWLDKAQRQIGDKKEINADVITAINDYIKKKDRLGLATFVSKLGESSGLEKAVGLWKASLLTGLRTHEANIIGNTAMAGLETIKDIPATGFDMVRSAITRSPRTKAFGVGTITDQFGGAIKGGKNAWEVLKTGTDPQDLTKAEFNKPLRYGNTPLGKAAQLMTNAVFRTLGAEDKIFYGAAYNRSMGEQMRLARINGKVVTEPTDEMIKAAVKDALYSTFTNENDLSNAIKGAKQAGGRKVAAAIDIIAPFTKTPTNVAKATFIDYTPVGLIDAVTQKIFGKEKIDNKDLAEAFGRSLTGTGALWLGVELAKRGLVSGASSNKETERSQAELENKTPNSIFINGAWQSASKISPLGNLILLGAAYHESGGNLAETAFAGAKGFSENSFLKGLSTAGQAFNEPKRNASNFINSAVSGYVPSIVSDIARGLDTDKRKPEGLVEKIQSRVPGLREALPEKLNALGEPVKEQGNFFSKIANPFNPSKPSDDPIVNEFKRVGYNLNYTGDSISIDGVDTKLTRDQEREYQKLAGKYIKQYIPEFINSSGYSGLSKDDQRDMIEKMVNTAKEQAREELKTKLNSIQSDSGMMAGAAGKEEEQVTPITFTSDSGSKIGNLIVSTREKDKFPFPDYSKSAPGQTLRADLNFEGKGDADIVFHFKTPSGKIVSFPQTKETFEGDKSYYGLELQIPTDAGMGTGEVWATVNGKEVAGTRKSHQVIGAPAVNRYERTSDNVMKQGIDMNNPTFERDDIRTQANIPDNIMYREGTSLKTIDLSPPSKGAGIGAFANQNWNITKAREVWNAEGISKEQKDQAFKKLGVKPEDARYDALANYDVDIKAQYLSSKSTTKEKLIENIKTGRKRSVGDLVFASDGVIDAMVDEGRLTKEEAKELKVIDYDKSGKLKVKAAGKGKRGAKPKMPTMKAIKLVIPKAKRVKTVKPRTVRAVKQYKLVTRKKVSKFS